MYSAIGVEPTKLTASMPRVREQRVDRFLVAVDDVEHAVRQPGLLQQARQLDGSSTGPSRSASA